MGTNSIEGGDPDSMLDPEPYALGLDRVTSEIIVVQQESETPGKLHGSHSEASVDLNDPEFLHFVLIRELQLFEEKLENRFRLQETIQLANGDQSDVKTVTFNKKKRIKKKKKLIPNLNDGRFKGMSALKKSHPYLSQQSRLRAKSVTSDTQQRSSIISFKTIRETAASKLRAISNKEKLKPKFTQYSEKSSTVDMIASTVDPANTIRIDIDSLGREEDIAYTSVHAIRNKSTADVLCSFSSKVNSSPRYYNFSIDYLY